VTSRTGAILGLVASLMLLAVVGWGLLGGASRGVGMDLPLRQAAADAPADRSASVPGPGQRAPSGDLGISDGARADEGGADARTDGGVSGPASAEVPRVDAGRLPVLPQAQAPRTLDIPSVGISMPVVATGVQPDGQMQLPEDPARIGWYRFGPAPGDSTGSAVLGGHVDSTRHGVGPLARLAAVQPGSRLAVTTADGSRVLYRVTDVERIRKAALPTDALFSPDGPPRLVVVTCGGRYLPDAGGYEDNIVVRAIPV